MKRIYLVLFLGLVLVGCGGGKAEEQEQKQKQKHEGHSHGHEGHSHKSHSMPEKSRTSTKPAVVDYKPTSAEIGLETVCVVMNNKFKIEENTDAVMYKGKKYFFCCGGCEPAFKKDPEKYIK